MSNQQHNFDYKASITVRDPLKAPNQTGYKELQKGDRFGSDPDHKLDPAFYLPHQGWHAEFQLPIVIEGGTFCSRDEEGRVVPANGIPFIPEHTTGGSAPVTTVAYYGRPLQYGASDLGNNATKIKTHNPVTNGLLDIADLEPEGTIDASGVGGKFFGRDLVSIRAGAFSLGVMWDTQLPSGLRNQARNYVGHAQNAAFIVDYLIEFGDRGGTRDVEVEGTSTPVTVATGTHRNYIQAVWDALDEFEALTGDDVTRPDWVTPQGQDLMLPGDLVAVDDRGQIVKYSCNTDIELPLATIGAVVGRVFQAGPTKSRGALHMVATGFDGRVTGGSHPDVANRGVEDHLWGASRRLTIRVGTL